ncbi:helix-turn-helix transcriptional regulator [Prauserella shujinwangii]|nr:winged helix-turn-helix domain-containing protein [Prauserella shujinwangii]
MSEATETSTRTKARATSPGWTFLTNHGHVLLCLASDSRLTMRELALKVGITERAVQGIVADLVEGGYLTRAKVGRRNSYTVNAQGRLRHPLEADHTVGALIDALADADRT